MIPVGAFPWGLALEHVVSFACGVVIGFVAANRYRIVRRNGETHDQDRV